MKSYGIMLLNLYSYRVFQIFVYLFVQIHLGFLYSFRFRKILTDSDYAYPSEESRTELRYIPVQRHKQTKAVLRGNSKCTSPYFCNSHHVDCAKPLMVTPFSRFPAHIPATGLTNKHPPGTMTWSNDYQIVPPPLFPNANGVQIPGKVYTLKKL